MLHTPVKINRMAWIPAALALFAAIPASAQTSPNSDTADYMLTDFENWNKTTRFGGYWYTFSDRNSATLIDTVYGNSTLTVFDSDSVPVYDSLGNYNRVMFPIGHTGDTSTHALRFGYKFGDRRLRCDPTTTCTYAPYVGFGAGFRSSGDTLDLSGAAGVAFWAKADSAPLVVNVSISTRDTTTGAAEYSQAFSLDTTWKQYSIQLAASTVFKLPSYSPLKPFVPSRATRIGFNMNLDENTAHPVNAWRIDDLVIQKWKYVEPVIPEDTISTGIPTARKPAEGRFGVLRTGDGFRVRLPVRYAGQKGRVEALDASGRVLAGAFFDSQATEVELPLASRSAFPGTVHFRVIASGPLR